jgi:hypothetical protein
VLRWTGLVVVGFVVAAAGWWEASGKVRFDSQAPFASVGLIGLTIGAYAQLAWLVRGWRAVSRRRIALSRHPIVAYDLHAATAVTDMSIVGVPGLRRYHRSDCPLALSRPVVREAREVHEREGRRPCGVCRP